jgi:hypothetical protein
MMEILRHNDIDHWRAAFVDALEAAPYSG